MKSFFFLFKASFFVLFNAIFFISLIKCNAIGFICLMQSYLLMECNLPYMWLLRLNSKVRGEHLTI